MATKAELEKKVQELEKQVQGEQADTGMAERVFITLISENERVNRGVSVARAGQLARQAFDIVDAFRAEALAEDEATG